MKTKICKRRGYIALVLDDPKYEKDRRPVLAAGTEMEGTGCWMLADIRLVERAQLSEYACSISADDVCSQILPETDELAIMIKSQLREFEISPEGTIQWCTFRNFFKGDVGVRGYIPPRAGAFKPPIYHSRTAVTAHLKHAQAFWEAYEGEISEARIVNPNAQPRESMFSFLSYEIDRRREQRLASAGDDRFTV
jgi:hypothetical protein